MILVPMILPIWRRRFAAEIWAMPEDGPQNDARLWWRGINHNRKGGGFEMEQPKVGPKGEPSGSERVKGHRG